MNQLTLRSRQGGFQLQPELDITIVGLVKKHKIPWGFMCERGNCAQCRTKVLDGSEYLNEITEAEKLRLRKAERAEGYRLGCQIKVNRSGNVTLVHSPY
jgi:2Fe-2S ferredoxin